MKNSLNLYFVTFLLLVSDFVAFAQTGPNDDDGGGGVETGDPEPAPINSKLILLAVAGVLFAIYTFRKNKRVI